MENKEIEKLMREAIEYPRPAQLSDLWLPVWNQPFFFKIDKARMLTLSYNPTDKGASTNYPWYVEEYKKKGYLETDKILDILYNYKKEIYWRKNFDLIGNVLGIKNVEIAHMDVSFFPYNSFSAYKGNEYLDDTYKFLLKVIEILDDQLNYILVDGARNESIIYKIMKNNYKCIDQCFMPINGGKTKYELSIYKHNDKNLYVVYYGCFLYGTTCPAKEKVEAIAKPIKEITQKSVYKLTPCSTRNDLEVTKETRVRKFLYKGDNKSFVGKIYIYNKGECLDEHYKKLQSLEEAEVYKAYSERKVEFISHIDHINMDYAGNHGTRAMDIYINMCSRFGWRLHFKGSFGPQRPLYAINATPEGYSVHFLRHNNWTKTDNGVWFNKIYRDRIEESWPQKEFYKPEYTHIKDEIRVVFAHNTKGYAFIGVYKTIGWEEKYDSQLNEQRIIKTYKLISKEYPAKI